MVGDARKEVRGHQPNDTKDGAESFSVPLPGPGCPQGADADANFVEIEVAIDPRTHHRQVVATALHLWFPRVALDDKLTPSLLGTCQDVPDILQDVRIDLVDDLRQLLGPTSPWDMLVQHACPRTS